MEKLTLEEIEMNLLPKGKRFTSQQKEAIEIEQSCNVNAAPGAGKTTVLTAKVAKLLKDRNDSDKAICIITHTNVAVEEVMLGLKKVEISEVSYPNFIGTIHEFFNYFFGRKAFHLLSAEKLSILDDEEYMNIFEPVFKSSHPGYPKNYNAPNIKYKNVNLQITDDYELEISSNCPSSYKSKYHDVINILFEKGYITHDISLQLARWYINKHNAELKGLISQRFGYILLDEAQDTSSKQYEILKLLLDQTSVVYQKFGDPNQALYNIFDDLPLNAWDPISEQVTNGIKKIDISETIRFNETISKLVKKLSYKESSSLKSLCDYHSMSPHFILFDTEEELFNRYKSFIENIENIDFCKSSRKDCIVSPFHSDLSKYFKWYEKENGKIKKSQSINYYLDEFLYEWLKKFEEISTKKILKEKIQEDDNLRVFIARTKRNILSGSFDELKLQKYFKEMYPDNDSLIQEFLSSLENFLKGPITKDLSQEAQMFDISTVHGVKGETHRSTLLIVDSKLSKQKDVNEDYFFKLLKNFLVGERVNYSGLKNKNDYMKALKLAYVALSRPTHLAALAIPRPYIDDDFHTSLIETGYVEID